MISLAIGGCTYTSGMVSLSSRKALAERASRLGGARRGRSLGPDIFPRQGPLEEHRVTPERSLDQRMDALSRANEVRVLRAQLKRDLKAGRVSIGALLLDPPACLGAAKLRHAAGGPEGREREGDQASEQLPDLVQQDVRRS